MVTPVRMPLMGLGSEVNRMLLEEHDIDIPASR